MASDTASGTSSATVGAAVDEMFPSDDPLDSLDFDVTEYINTIFPTEQSLSGLDSFIDNLRGSINDMNAEIRDNIRIQSRTSDEGTSALLDAQEGLADLMMRVRDIRDKAEASETMVQEITRDIKSLDLAKKNLTASITALNHLHMLVGGVDSLADMTKRRQYRDAAHLLAAVKNVMQHFSNHTHIEQIAELVRRINNVEESLKRQITTEFRTSLEQLAAAQQASDENKPSIDVNKLREACDVLDVLDPAIKEELVNWFVASIFREYEQLFAPDGRLAWLDTIEKRFIWIKRTLTEYNEVYDSVFPAKWEMQEKLSHTFCAMTRKHLSAVMKQRKSEIDVQLLLHAIQASVDFEQWLAMTFPEKTEEDAATGHEESKSGPEKEPEPKKQMSELEAIREKYRRNRLRRQQRQQQESGELSTATAPSGPVSKAAKPADSGRFKGVISVVFEDYLDVYVDAQDKNLSVLMDRFIKDFKSSLMFPEVEDEDGAPVLPSAGDLFVFFRNCIVQCSQLTTKQPLHDLHLIFKRHLKTYASKILSDNLPKSSSILGGILHRDSDIRLSPEEQKLVCSILVTANYCYDTTSQMQEKLVEKLQEPWSSKVDLSDEEDAFTEVIRATVQILVRSLETLCDPSLTAMTKMRWEMDEVGDTSPYISNIGKGLTQAIPVLRKHLASNRHFFNNVCTKFCQSFIPRVIVSLHKCKHINSVGAEQLLLDVQSLKQVLLNMPNLGVAQPRKPTATYVRTVTEGLGKAEMLLKVLMTPHEAPDLFVQDYLKLIGDAEGIAAFQKLLDMKGVKKAEQQALLEAYRQETGLEETAASKTDGEQGVAGNGDDTADKSKSGVSSDGKAESASGKPEKSERRSLRSNINIRKLERLMKRFQSSDKKS